MNEEEIATRQQEIDIARLGLAQQEQQNQQEQRYTEPQETSMIKEQLDLGEELERIDYLLRGFTLERGEWKAPTTQDLVVLSEYGVHLIRNTIAWYLNKNTLLSNYDEDTILTKMLDFSNDLNDTIFMEYEKVFQYPTTKECITVLEERIQKRAEIAQYALKLVGKDSNLEEIKREKIKEIEDRIENEIEKIKEQIIKSKLKRFLMVMRQVQDAIHSTYLRALHGTERSSLRRHMSVTETKGIGNSMPTKHGGFFPWSKK